MQISQIGLNLIKRFEGCRLVSYADIVGVWTIGYGHTAGVGPGQTISQQQADDMLQADVDSFASSLSKYIVAPVSQNQFDACVSLAFNVGTSAFAGSTLLRLLNKKDYEGAANQFPRWNRAGGKPVAGLTKRRLAEQALFLGK